MAQRVVFINDFCGSGFFGAKGLCRFGEYLMEKIVNRSANWFFP